MNDLLKWGLVTADNDSREPNFDVVPWIGEPVSAATCTVFAALALHHAWSRRAHWRSPRPFVWLYVAHVASGVTGLAYHLSLKWGAQAVDRFASCMWLAAVLQILSYGALRAPLPRAAVRAVIAVCAVATFFHRHALCFGALLLACIAVGAAGRPRWQPRDARLHDAGVDAVVRSLLAVAVFVADDVHVFGVNYYHAAWHLLAADATLRVTYWLERFDRAMGSPPTTTVTAAAKHTA